MAYIAGYNQPGYLPEAGVHEFNTFDEAKQYIIDELLDYANSISEILTEARQYPNVNYELLSPAVSVSEDLTENLTHLVEAIKIQTSEFTTDVTPDGYVYWVMKS